MRFEVDMIDSRSGRMIEGLLRGGEKRQNRHSLRGDASVNTRTCAASPGEPLDRPKKRTVRSARLVA